jgi:hypothetical protein
MEIMSSIPNMRTVSNLLDAFTSTLSTDEQKAFIEYWQNYCSDRKAGDPFQLPPLERPYWMLLPWWLLRGSNAQNTKQILTDILAAQYLLFVAFRVYDDLLDEETGHPLALISVPAALLRQAERIFERLFPKSSVFWDRYPGLIAETTDAIAKADLLQRTPASRPERLLDEYARINSIFLAGSWAACVLTGRYDKLEQVKSFADKLSRGAQILDDFFDMTEDLKRSRYNYVANVLMRRSQWINPLAPSGKVVFPEEALENIIRLVGNFYSTAYEQLRGMEIPESSRFAEEYIARIKSVRIMFCPLTPESSRRQRASIHTSYNVDNDCLALSEASPE